MKLKQIFRLIYPLHCTNCGKIIPIPDTYCKCFGNKIDIINGEICINCGNRINLCTCNQKDEIKLSQIVAPYYYTGIIRAKIHNLKFNGEISEADNLAAAMTDRFLDVFENVNFDLVTFVPMTEEDEKKRGFNQSKILAKKVSENLGLPLFQTIKKTRSTKQRHRLSLRERKSNIENSFEIFSKNTVDGKTIILVDDVKTTGQTLFECERLLFENGAENVFCLCAAITEFHNIFN